MRSNRKRFWAGVLAGIAGTLAVLFAGTLVLVYGGAYDVAADRGHAAATRWLLDGTLRSSVRARADAEPGVSGAEAADVAAGAAEYKSMCEHCHGGPGVEPSGWSRGMLPQPPHLTRAAAEWSVAEVRWIVRHGLKYTGMPAFGATHDEAVLDDIAAFVARLPAMTPEQYRAYGGGHTHGPGDPGRPTRQGR
ncbi:cytochrome c [Luteimonas sp. RD2P54]|uniref:Cytochrome c n=1 Tax=Luteimonas endophytica TaxID=3042023 RepID=A0ABT6JE28_9GAMM|nr:cytochrome c [Luteimonas endophytica]MDH5825036.1 cytochrome c [Luteimonas endophytica]